MLKACMRAPCTILRAACMRRRLLGGSGGRESFSADPAAHDVVRRTGRPPTSRGKQCISLHVSRSDLSGATISAYVRSHAASDAPSRFSDG